MRGGSVTFPNIVLVMSCSALFVGAGGCAREEKPSNLAARSANDSAPGDGERGLPPPSKFPAPPSKDGASSPDPDAKAPATKEGEPAKSPSFEPPRESERVELSLSLQDGTKYVVTTVGMLELPMVQGKPTGFARREVITFDECEGEGGDRSCVIEHRYTEFEAEPPTGKLLESDEARVSDLVTRHRIGPDGERVGETEVEGKPTSPSVLEQMKQAHRFYCLRFPAEAVGVGAKWKASCKGFMGGRLVERNVQWELSELSTDDEGQKRAELRVIGEVLVPDDEGNPRKGTVQGVLYYFVDHQKPHILRELHTVPLVEGKAAYTKRTLNMQFAHPVPGKPEEFTRTDGQPLAATPLSSVPQTEPADKPGRKGEADRPTK